VAHAGHQRGRRRAVDAVVEPEASPVLVARLGVAHVQVGAFGQQVFGAEAVALRIAADEVSVDGLEPTTFAKFPGVVVMKNGHPLARHKQIRPEQLAELPFLALNPEDASRRRLEAALAVHGVSLSVSVHTPYAASVCEMAMHGLGIGIGIVNPITALDYAQRGLVVRKLTVDVTFSCLLAIPAGRVLSGTAKSFLALMRSHLQEDEQMLRDYLRAV